MYPRADAARTAGWRRRSALLSPSMEPKLSPRVPEAHHQSAKYVADLIARPEDVRAVCLVGSVARGDDTVDSDIDLVVIGRRRLRRCELMERIPAHARDPRLSFISFSRKAWAAEIERGSLFVHHLRLEGVALLDRDGELEAAFADAPRHPPDAERELRHQLRRLRLYREPERLNGEHLFALSHLYAIGKAIAIARCFELGEPTFVKEEALARLARRRPALAEDVARVRELRPFYDLTRERERSPLPFEPIDVEHELRRASTAIERLAHG